MSRFPDDTNQRYEAMQDEAVALTHKAVAGQTLTDREQIFIGLASAAAILAQALIFVKGTEEAERIEKSTALKDRFKRWKAGGFIFPQTSDPMVIRAARKEAMESFDKGMAAYDARAALLAEQEKLAADHKALTAAQAQRLAELEKECHAINDKVAAGTARDISVAKPLKLKTP